MRHTESPHALVDQILPPGRFLSKKQVTSFFEVTPRTLERWVKERNFPRPLHIGGWARWPRESIRLYLVRSTQKPR